MPCELSEMGEFAAIRCQQIKLQIVNHTVAQRMGEVILKPHTAGRGQKVAEFLCADQGLRRLPQPALLQRIDAQKRAVGCQCVVAEWCL